MFAATEKRDMPIKCNDGNIESIQNKYLFLGLSLLKINLNVG